MATAEQWRDLAGIIRAAGNGDGRLVAELLALTPDPDWVIGALARLLWNELGAEGADRIYEKGLAA